MRITEHYRKSSKLIKKKKKILILGNLSVIIKIDKLMERSQ